MRILLVILLLFIINMRTAAQQIIARQVPFYYQLFSNEIWDFYQDKEGYLWIGTTNGLVRYDGYDLQTFRSGNLSPDLLTDNSIVCMTDDDVHLWIGTRKGLNLFEKETCRMIPVSETSLSDKSIEAILIGKDGYTWIAVEGTMYKCDSEARILNEYTLSAHPITQIYQDTDENIWVLMWNDGLFRYNPQTDSFISYPRIGELNCSFTMYQDNRGRYWIGTWGEGLWQFFPDRDNENLYERHHVINSLNGQSEPIFYSLTQDDTYGYLWALSFNELYALEVQNDGTLKNVDINHLLDTHMMFTRIFKDQSGNLWLSSYDMAYTIFFDHSEITNYQLPQIKERFGWDANITNLCLDNDGMMWVNQDRYGLCLYDPQRDKLSAGTISNYSTPIEVGVLSKSHKNKGVWLGTSASPIIMRLVQQDMNIRMEEYIDLSNFAPESGQIQQLLEDANGNLWIATTTSLFLKPSGEQTIIPADKDLPHLSALAADQSGRIWGIASEGYIYHLENKHKGILWELYPQVEGLSPGETILNACIDHNGCFWILSSRRQVYRTDPDKRLLTPVFINGELEDSSVLDLLADGNHVWIVTNKKAIQVNADNSSVYTYHASDGNIFVNIFRHKAMTPDGNGGIYVGGHGGFSHIRSFHSSGPEEIQVHPAVTDVKADNKSILFSSTDTRNAQKNTVHKVYMEPGDRNIEISISTLRYRLTPKERMAYKLEGVDTDWIILDHPRNTAFYNRLDKGTYKLWLRSEYEPGCWTTPEMALTIEKRPAMYETWYAFLAYALFGMLLVYLLLQALMKRVKAKNDIRFREELNRAKLDYFTNVSHDVLTPLTIIACSVDNIESGTATIGKETAILKSNINKLKRLIQQILDFRKMDSGSMQLSVSRVNISEFIGNICRTSFLPLAEKKNIDLQVDIPTGEWYGYADFDKLDKILYNLLSNAIKYTPRDKSIRVTARQTVEEGHAWMELIVEDNGIGIHPAEIGRIFNRFYTHKKLKEVESNGIGLSLVKDLVNLHHGQIYVESTPGTGSTFTVLLPIAKESFTADELADNLTDAGTNLVIETSIPLTETDIVVDEEEIGLPADNEKPVVLLVDDNSELLYTLKTMFKERYHVLTATSGRQAWEKLDKYDIDIVISDVMMPDENGWEFCKRIKSDLRFNHIPVIMLTAKNGMGDRVTSYEAGADGYIAKPFDKKVLIARVDNLVKSYKMRQSAFRKTESTNLDGIAYQSADKQFLQTVIASIMSHIEEAEFDLEKLSSEMSISKSTLYRKIKSMTGLTPLDFIRNIKMKRACTMLHDRTFTISEVAYAVGFNNPKYFSKCFKEEFGVTPSEYQAARQD